MNKLLNPKNQAFVLASIREREMISLFQILRTDFEITQLSDVAGYSSWDAVIISADTEMLVEVKVRDWSVNQFNTLIFEEKKFLKLKDVQERMFKKTGRYLPKYYINIFKDGVLIWNLDEYSPTFSIRDSKVATVVDNGRVNKSVAMLESNRATKYEYNMQMEYINEVSEQKFKLLYPNETEYLKLFLNKI